MWSRALLEMAKDNDQSMVASIFLTTSLLDQG